MKEFTAIVYRLGIEFLYEAIRYYSTGPLHRLWHVATKPPSMRLTEKVTDIKTAIEEMTKEKEMLNGIRLFNVESKVEHLVESVDTLEKSVDEVKGVVQGMNTSAWCLFYEEKYLRQQVFNDAMTMMISSQ
jgi:hypothetical protein